MSNICHLTKHVNKISVPLFRLHPQNRLALLLAIEFYRHGVDMNVEKSTLNNEYLINNFSAIEANISSPNREVLFQ